MPTVDVIIPSYNTKRLTMECIESVAKTLTPIKIIVVDNASTDGSADAIRQFWPSVTVIQSKTNEGYAKACNKGARDGNSPYILFLNSDTLIADNLWLAKMIKTFESDDKIAVVGPKLVNEKNQLTGCGVVGTNAKPYIRGWLEPNTFESYNKQTECLSVCGACMMIKRDNVPVIGLMDEQYPFYFEETDYCYNARDKGYKVVYTPDTTVVHYHQKSSKDKESARKWFDIGKKIFDAKWAHIMGDRKIYG